jgi:hypothetical protein
MVIDSSVVINLPHDGEFRVKKRQEASEIKPVETSGKGDEPELDISRDKITEKTPEVRSFDAGEIYNKYGEIGNGGNGDDEAQMKTKSIDVII